MVIEDTSLYTGIFLYYCLQCLIEEINMIKSKLYKNNVQKYCAKLKVAECAKLVTIEIRIRPLSAVHSYCFIICLPTEASASPGYTGGGADKTGTLLATGCTMGMAGPSWVATAFRWFCIYRSCLCLRLW